MAAASEGPDIPLSKVSERYKDRWVAVVVTSRDKNLQPLTGRVVADDVDRYRLRDKVLQYNDICILYAGDCPYPLML